MFDVASSDSAERNPARAARRLGDLARGRVRVSKMRTLWAFIIGALCCAAAQNLIPLVWSAGFSITLFFERIAHRKIAAACDSGVPPKRVGGALFWTTLQSLYAGTISAWLWFAPYPHSETIAFFFLIAGLINAAAALHGDMRFVIAGAGSAAAFLLGLPVAQFILGGCAQWLDLAPAVAIAMFLLFSRSLWLSLKTSEAAQWEAEHALMREQEARTSARVVKAQTLALVQDALRTPLKALLGAAKKEQGPAYQAATLVRDIVHAMALEHPETRSAAAARITMCDPGALARAAASAFQMKAQDRGLELFLDVDADASAAIMADTTRLSAILYNLIANALAATRHGGVRIRVQSRPAEQPGFVCLGFCIADTGVGMSRSQLALLFQGDPDTTHAASGLIIARRAARRLGGRIQAKSELGAGSVVTFIFEAKLAEPVPQVKAS